MDPPGEVVGAYFFGGGFGAGSGCDLRHHSTRSRETEPLPRQSGHSGRGSSSGHRMHGTNVSRVRRNSSMSGVFFCGIYGNVAQKASTVDSPTLSRNHTPLTFRNLAIPSSTLPTILLKKQSDVFDESPVDTDCPFDAL
jgi:hypothetical protein